MGKKLFLIFLFTLIALFGLYLYLNRTIKITEAAPTTESITEEDTQVSISNLTFLAAGDNLIHHTLFLRHQKGNTYDFSPMYSEIKNLIQNANFAFINQETVMAGSSYGYSGYPLFNSPQELAHTLYDTGFNIINLANNHSMDMGAEGLYDTLDFLATIQGLEVIGARRSGDSHKIFTANNISIGILSYTYAVNAFHLPQDNPNLVSLITERRMSREINILRPQCDFLIVSMHWGDEYSLQPSARQKDLARFFAEHNVDVIAGHHPHVLQPVEVLNRPDGGTTICFYSLGNFVSHQRGKERHLGGIMLVTFTKELGNDHIKKHISNFGLIPIINHFEKSYTNTKVYPLYNYNEELLSKHLERIEDNDMTFDFFNSILSRLGTNIIMETPKILNRIPEFP